MPGFFFDRLNIPLPSRILVGKSWNRSCPARVTSTQPGGFIQPDSPVIASGTTMSSFLPGFLHFFYIIGASMNSLSWKCLAVLALALTIAGCGEPGPRLYKAGGTVNYKSAPVEGAQVTFAYEDGE